MNDVIKGLIERRSCRSYRSEQIPDDILNEIVRAGLYAPSASNRQDVMMAVIQDPDEIRKLSQLNARIMGSSHDPFYGAPTVIVVLAKEESHTGVEDGSLVIGNMLNAAHALGIGSCWIHRAYEEFSSEEGKGFLRRWGIDGDWRGVGHCILGYAIEEAPVKPRKEGRVRYVR